MALVSLNDTYLKYLQLHCDYIERYSALEQQHMHHDDRES